MARDLKDKVIVITGGSSGIGRATALACHDAGMKVVVCGRDQTALDEVARQTDGLAIVCDVNHDDQVAALFDQAWQHHGRLDAAFANAGFGLSDTVLDTDDDAHRAMFETNYWGTIRTIKQAVPRLRDTPGGLRHMLICSSAASEIGLPTAGPYAATKAAQDSIAGALRGELADEGIAVTSVHPIGTRTQFFERAGMNQGGGGTPESMHQSVEHVANRIVSAIRSPKAEVWPSRPARFALATATALPGFAAFMMKRKYAKHQSTD
jgi:short-subunit dehydrogenase